MPPVSSDDHPTSPDERLRLRRIARTQRVVIVAIIGYFSTALAGALLGSSDLGRIFAWTLGLSTGVLALYGAPTLAYRLFGKGAAILTGILVLVPAIGFVVLLVLSGMTNRRMKRAGVEVGRLFGTKLKQFG